MNRRHWRQCFLKLFILMLGAYVIFITLWWELILGCSRKGLKPASDANSSPAALGMILLVKLQRRKNNFLSLKNLHLSQDDVVKMPQED
jgi:hypothetical protein